MRTKAGEYLIEKYTRYITNIEWHIKTNQPFGEEMLIIQKQLDCYKEIVADLKKFNL